MRIIDEQSSQNPGFLWAIFRGRHGITISSLSISTFQRGRGKAGYAAQIYRGPFDRTEKRGSWIEGLKRGKAGQKEARGVTRGIYTVDLAGARSHGTVRRHRVSSSSRRGREDAPRPVQTSVPTATDMFEQIVQDKPACFGNEPLSSRTYHFVYVRACTYTSWQLCRSHIRSHVSLSLSFAQLNPWPGFLKFVFSVTATVMERVLSCLLSR